MKLPKKLRYSILPVAALICAALASVSFPQKTDSPAAVTFIDVGQGDSILIKAPNGKTLLVDGGEYEAYDDELKPYLLSQGIASVDFALATHYHSDHMGGIHELVEDGGAETLIIPDYEPSNSAKEKLEKAARKTETQVVEVSEGDSIELGDPDISISVLHPDQGGFDSKNENSNSIVLLVSCFDTSILLTGDLEEDAEEVLKDKYDLEVDILKIGHHGSSTSTSKAFLEAADPTYGIIQCGADNRYGHPHYETLDALADNDVLVYRTDEDGDIEVQIDQTGIKEINTQRN